MNIYKEEKAPLFAGYFYYGGIFEMTNKTRFEERRVLRTIVGAGIFSALAYVIALMCEPIPAVAGFLSIDIKDAVIAIASFIYGPIVAPIISFIVAGVELVTIGSDTAWYGFIMNFASSAVFSTSASLIYRYRKNINSALIGFFVAIASTTGVMLLLNAFVTPIFVASRGIPFDVIPNLPILFLPFNFAKTLLNSSVAMLLYKPITNAMRSAKLIPRGQHKATFNKKSVVILIVGGALLLLALILFVYLFAFYDLVKERLL